MKIYLTKKCYEKKEKGKVRIRTKLLNPWRERKSKPTLGRTNTTEPVPLPMVQLVVIGIYQIWFFLYNYGHIFDEISKKKMGLTQERINRRKPVSQFILPPGQVAPRGASQPWTGCPPGGNLSRDILPPTLVIFTPGGRHIPAGLSCPPGVKINQPGYLAPHPWFWSSNCPEILKLLLISQACINGIFHIIQIRLLVVTLTNFLENSPFLGGPHPAFWSSN